MVEKLINELLSTGKASYKISELDFDIDVVRDSELLPSRPWLCLKRELDQASLFLNKEDFKKCAGFSYHGNCRKFNFATKSYSNDYD